MAETRSYTSTITILKNAFSNAIGIFLSIVLFISLISCSGSEKETSSSILNDSETHYIKPPELKDLSQYWNTSWLGRSSELYVEIQDLTSTYLQGNQYVFGDKDCNDMAVDLWHKFYNREIKSLIAVGNLEKSDEMFLECNHAWLMIYSGEGSAAVIDLACTKVYTWEDVRNNPQLRQYWEGFIYQKPSDLLTDFKERW